MSSAGSKVWFTTLTIAACVIALAVGFGLVKSDAHRQMFPMKHMVIQSRFDHISAEQIHAAGQKHVSGGFFAVDLTLLRKEIGTLPWVARVEVRKRWPDTVIVRVHERKVLAHWADLDRENPTDVLVDVNGDAFEVEGADAIRGLPRLSSPSAARASLVTFYTASAQSLRGLGLHLVALRFSKRGSLTATLSDGSKIRLGIEQHGERWDRMVKNLPTLLSQNLGKRMIELDLRYTNGMAARFEDVLAPEATSPEFAPPMPAMVRQRERSAVAMSDANAHARSLATP